MSAPSKAPIGVPFKIHIIGSITGKAWPGDFRAKTTLTFRDKLNADRFRRELIGDAGGMVDGEAAVAALVISQLSVRLTEWPKWWEETKGGLELEDPNILEELYKEVTRIENDHMKKVEAEGAVAQTALREGKA